MTGDLQKAQQAFIALYCEDVANNPECFKDRVRDHPEESARRIIEGLPVKDVLCFTRDLRDEIRAVERLA